jgi:hypothetical protein
MLRDWGVCWLLAVFSVRDLSRQSTTLVGPMEDPGQRLTSVAAMCMALGRSTFVSASLRHNPKSFGTPVSNATTPTPTARQKRSLHTLIRRVLTTAGQCVSRVRRPTIHRRVHTAAEHPGIGAPNDGGACFRGRPVPGSMGAETTPMLLNPPIRSEMCTLPSFSGIAQTHMPDLTTLCRAALGTNVVVCGAANFGTDRAAGIDNRSGHVAAWR